jgi:hypothetical protein
MAKHREQVDVAGKKGKEGQKAKSGAFEPAARDLQALRDELATAEGGRSLPTLNSGR